LGWQRLCSAQEVAIGRLTSVEVQGVKVLVTRVGSDFFALPPLCPHMAEPLEISGVCADGMLTCTKHIWQWDLRSGEPERRGREAPPLLSDKAARRRPLDRFRSRAHVWSWQL